MSITEQKASQKFPKLYLVNIFDDELIEILLLLLRDISSDTLLRPTRTRMPNI